MSEQTDKLRRMAQTIQQSQVDLKNDRLVMKERAGALKQMEQEYLKLSLEEFEKK